MLVEATGAFDVFSNIRHWEDGSLDCAFQLLERAGVVMTPDIVLGTHGDGLARISYANSAEDIEEGLDRQESFPGKDSVRS